MNEKNMCLSLDIRQPVLYELQMLVTSSVTIHLAYGLLRIFYVFQIVLFILLFS